MNLSATRVLILWTSSIDEQEWEDTVHKIEGSSHANSDEAEHQHHKPVGDIAAAEHAPSTPTDNLASSEQDVPATSAALPSSSQLAAQRQFSTDASTAPLKGSDIPPSLAHAMSEKKNIERIADLLEDEGLDVRIADLQEDLVRAIDAVTVHDPHAVISLVDQWPGEVAGHACIPAAIASLEYNVVGSPGLTIAKSVDRSVVHSILDGVGLPVPNWIVINDARSTEGMEDLEYPCIVTQVYDDIYEIEGQSAALHSPEEVRQKIAALAADYDLPLMVEEYIDGRRFHVLVFGWPNLETSPMVELAPEEAPMPIRTQYVVATDIPHIKHLEMRDLARRAAEAIGIRDIGMVDIHLTPDNTAFVTDVRPVVDFAPQAPFWAAIDASRQGMSGTLKQIVEGSLHRGDEKLVTRSDVFREQLNSRLKVMREREKMHEEEMRRARAMQAQQVTAKDTQGGADITNTTAEPPSPASADSGEVSGPSKDTPQDKSGS